MNDLDQLADRLHELGRRAPVPIADPLLDLRRGRVALRRRHARWPAGVTTALVAAGAVATTFPDLHLPGDGSTAVSPAGSPSGATSPLPATKDLCTIGAPAAGGLTRRNAPEVAAALLAYRAAAVAILDPSGTYLDPADSKRSTNVQSGSVCDPRTGEQLTRLGTKIGWTGGGGLGVIQIEVVSPAHDGESQILLAHTTWEIWRSSEPLPGGVVNVRVATYSEDGGGRAIVVERPDGLTVAIDAAGRWGNNAAPGSPAATGLPAIDRLLELAASPDLALPER